MPRLFFFFFSQNMMRETLKIFSANLLHVTSAACHRLISLAAASSCTTYSAGLHPAYPFGLTSELMPSTFLAVKQYHSNITLQLCYCYCLLHFLCCLPQVGGTISTLPVQPPVLFERTLLPPLLYTATLHIIVTAIPHTTADQH
jgi:hypothetical protein